MDQESLDRLSARVEMRPGSEPLQRRPLGTTPPPAPAAWGRVPPPRAPSLLGRFSVLEYLFAGSVVFFIVAATVAGLIIFSGDTTVSTKNVRIDIQGPTAVRAGDEVSLQILITNNNPAPMNLTDLLVEYPTGTRSAADVSLDLPRIRESLGTIQPGETVTRTVQAVLFGERGTELTVAVSAEYRVPSSNAVFRSEGEYHTTISQSPASISVVSLSEVVSGEPAEIRVRVASNATEPLLGMLLVATYPPGFTFISSSPAPRAGSNVWDLGTVLPSGEREIVIRGSFVGEDGSDRVVHFTTGSQKQGTDTIQAPLAATDISLLVAKPFVSVQLSLNGDSAPEKNIQRGVPVRGEIRWTNNLPTRIQDVEIQLRLNGAVLDKSSVKSEQGFYRSSDTTIIFSPETDRRLEDVSPGESQFATFEFAALPQNAGSFRSPQITLAATVRGKRTAEGNVQEEVGSSAKAVALVSTDLALSATLARSSGPQPPKVEQETLYIVSWTVTNSSNAVADTVVTALLPNYVEWKSAVSGAVSYHENGRSISWEIGDLAPGEQRTAAFAIGAVPSLSQVNSMPSLVVDQRVSAFDRFIRATVERSSGSLTTGTGVSSQQGTVVP